MAEIPYNYESRRAAWEASKARIQESQLLGKSAWWSEPESSDDTWVTTLDLGGEPIEELDDWGEEAPLRPRLRGTAGEWPEEEYVTLQSWSDECARYRAPMRKYYVA